MDFIMFADRVEGVKRTNKILFGLPHDTIASDEELSAVQSCLQVTFPKDYADFLQAYGGGYFGYTVVYSCDPDSWFYLPNHVTSQWVHAHDFLPIVDFETGDLGGFRVKDNVCGNVVSIFDHEKNCVPEDGGMDFFSFLLRHGLSMEI